MDLQNKQYTPHYYGDLIRKLLFFGALIMLLGFPFFHDKMTAPVLLGVLGILVIVLVAGLTNPKQKYTIFLGVLISLIAVGVAEYEAITQAHLLIEYGGTGYERGYFWFSQAIAVIFFVSLYFGAKTIRGMNVPEDNQQ